MENLEYKIKGERQEKDEFFGRSPRSPISEDERREFDGLNYFPVDSDLRFELELKEHDDKKEITVKIPKEENRNLFAGESLILKLTEKNKHFTLLREILKKKDSGLPSKMRLMEKKLTEQDVIWI